MFIENFIEFVFNGSESVIFNNEEISQEIVFKNGYENELFMSESGVGLSMQNFKGRSFEFLINPNKTYKTRTKLQRVLELSALPYTLEFRVNYYLSYIPNFPPSTTPSYTENPTLSAAAVKFQNAVISYANESYEKNKKGRGLRIGLDQSAPFVVTETEAPNALFPCGNVTNDMFDFSVTGTETPPASGFWELTDWQFILNGSQTYIDSILQYPATGEYWVGSTPGAPGAGNILDKNSGNNRYNDQLGPYTYAAGTILTVQWLNVVVQLNTGVICNATTVTKTFRVG